MLIHAAPNGSFSLKLRHVCAKALMSNLTSHVRTTCRIVIVLKLKLWLWYPSGQANFQSSSHWWHVCGSTRVWYLWWWWHAQLPCGARLAIYIIYCILMQCSASAWFHGVLFPLLIAIVLGDALCCQLSSFYKRTCRSFCLDARTAISLFLHYHLLHICGAPWSPLQIVRNNRNVVKLARV